MEKTETSLIPKNPSRPEGEADNERRETQSVGSDLELLPFCFVKIYPEDALPRNMMKEVVKLFEERDQRLLQISEEIRDKAFERERAISKMEDLKYKLRNLNWELGELSNAKHAYRRTPREEEVDHSHAVSDVLMEMRKEKQRLEAKIKDAEEEFEAIKEEIWSHMEHLKDKHHRNEASVCILRQSKVRGKDRWFFHFCYLESIHGGITSMEKPSITSETIGD